MCHFAIVWMSLFLYEFELIREFYALFLDGTAFESGRSTVLFQAIYCVFEAGKSVLDFCTFVLYFSCLCIFAQIRM